MGKARRVPCSYPKTGGISCVDVKSVCQCTNSWMSLLSLIQSTQSITMRLRREKGQFEQGMEALSQMDRIKQVEAIHSYNTMKEDLMQYLGKFAENGKVVREEDIKEFFEKMKSNKKPRLGSAPPGTCK